MLNNQVPSTDLYVVAPLGPCQYDAGDLNSPILCKFASRFNIHGQFTLFVEDKKLTNDWLIVTSLISSLLDNFFHSSTALLSLLFAVH